MILPPEIMRLHNVLKFVIAIVVSEAAGVIGAIFTTPAIQSGWYATLARPAFNPPAWVFGPVWTTLFALMGIAVFLVYIKDEKTVLSEVEGRRFKRNKKIALVLFGIQLVLNTLWSIIFFGSTSLTINGLNNIGIAFIEIIFLWLAILATIIAFAKISKPAAWLLVPYIIWVSFAGYLNFMIWMLN